MPGSIQRKPQEFDAITIRGHRIIRKYKCVQSALRTVERAVAVHGDNGISDYEVRTNRGADIENAFVDSGPVKDVLGPAVAAARHNAKHVFHAERYHGPVVR